MTTISQVTILSLWW